MQQASSSLGSYVRSPTSQRCMRCNTHNRMRASQTLEIAVYNHILYDLFTMLEIRSSQALGTTAPKPPKEPETLHSGCANSYRETLQTQYLIILSCMHKSGVADLTSFYPHHHGREGGCFPLLTNLLCCICPPYNWRGRCVYTGWSLVA